MLTVEAICNSMHDLLWQYLDRLRRIALCHDILQLI
jgi:hypothetical protein